MTDERVHRRLAAILAADVVGFSKLMGADETGTLRLLNAHRQEHIDPCVERFNGRIFKTTGDGLLVEFSSIVDAVECAVEIQGGMKRRNADVPYDKKLLLRIGLNLGDIILQDGDVFGDGVNVAARLEGIAPVGGILISQEAVRQVHGKTPIAFETIGTHQLKNIAVPVTVYRVVATDVHSDSAVSLALPHALAEPSDKPSIAVLPFENLGGDSSQDYFSDGLTEDLITTLSKISGLFIIARNATFAFKRKTDDWRKIAAELKVSHFMTGSVRTAGQRMRISAQLVSATDGRQLWAERFDRVVDDVFAVQDEIVLRLATELEVRFTEGEQARLRLTTTNNVDAWHNWAKGLAYFRSSVTKDGVGRAREFWEKAFEQDPGSATLNAMLGLLHWASARYGWWDDRSTCLSRARGYADAAVQLDPGSADGHCVQALTLLMAGHHNEALNEARVSVHLGPNSADIAAFTSLVFNFCGEPAEALTQITRAMRLSPIYPSWYLGDLGFANRLLGRFDEAIAAFEEYGRRSSGFGHIDLVILYQKTGRLDEAKVHVQQLMDARPDFEINAWKNTQFYSDAKLLTEDVAALRASGLV